MGYSNLLKCFTAAIPPIAIGAIGTFFAIITYAHIMLTFCYVKISRKGRKDI